MATERDELLFLLEEKDRRTRTTKLHSYYPDTGPLKRELYPKHIEFFRAGAKYHQRLFMGGNRVGKCISYNSLVETCDGPRTVGELYEGGKPFDVWAWDGTKRVRAKASAPFQKPGWHECFRLTRSDGRWVNCADEHRVLTVDGFQPLSAALLEWASNPPVVVDGADKIVQVQSVGVKRVFDFTVKTHHNYIAAGMVHHNTEGTGLYESVVHATGLYPPWWEGRRWNRPVRGWLAGESARVVRDVLQYKLLGPLSDIGTGLLPQSTIKRATRLPALSDAVDTLTIRHVSGGDSSLGFKSYKEGEASFVGTEQDFILFDEEPSQRVYAEALTRVATGSGMVMLVFTPLEGLSDVVLSFLPDGAMPTAPDEVASKYVVMVSWDDVPHLTREMKDILLASYPVHQRDSRSKGVPYLGDGAIYDQIDEASVLYDPFPLPPHWPRAFGLDVGWNQTAAVWGAWDRDNDIVYLYREYYPSRLDPGTDSTRVHGAAIKAAGSWIPGAVDPSSIGANIKDGTTIIQSYKDLGLDLEPAENAREAGIWACNQRYMDGRMKVSTALTNLRRERKLYHRKNGLVVKKMDHLMDAKRYLVVSGLERARVDPGTVLKESAEFDPLDYNYGWMA